MKTLNLEIYHQQLQADCAKRRRRVLRNMGNNDILLLRSAAQSIFSKDVNHPYRQNSHFHYLTGFAEDNACLALMPNGEHGDYLLFCQPQSKHEMIWEGKRAGVQKATSEFHADKAYPIEHLQSLLPEFLSGRERLHCDPQDQAFFMQLLAHTNPRRGITAPQQFLAADLLLDDLRLIKSPLERGLASSAAQIAVNAHHRAWAYCRPGVTEYQVEAEILHEYHRCGARPSYPSIVATGANACVLHYINNSSTLKKGDLLLIDAGAEYQMYASDITRTVPVSGRFTTPQREVYEVVLDAQKKAIAKVKPGNTWDIVHRAAVKAITRGLVDIGLLRGSVTALIKKKAYLQYFMHGTGHWLGMDVHDAGSYLCDDQPRRFEPSMLLTIEPGIYIRDSQQRAFRHIGIRIEDDVLVTTSGQKVLTDKLVKEPDAIEKTMASLQTHH